MKLPAHPVKTGQARQELPGVYIENHFHRPLAPRRRRLVRDTENTERNVLMENREVPILHEPPALRQR